MVKTRAEEGDYVAFRSAELAHACLSTTGWAYNVTVVSVAELGEDYHFDFENSKLIATYFGTQH